MADIKKLLQKMIAFTCDCITPQANSCWLLTRGLHSILGQTIWSVLCTK